MQRSACDWEVADSNLLLYQNVSGNPRWSPPPFSLLGALERSPLLHAKCCSTLVGGALSGGSSSVKTIVKSSCFWVGLVQLKMICDFSVHLVV